MREGPVLRAEHLEVRYGKVIAAADISLDVRRGEIVTLLGPNGAGKTSVLKSIMGLVPLAKGRVTFDDGERVHEIQGKPPHELARLGIGTVPAQHVILPRMTVAENLEMGGRFLMADLNTVRRRVREQMEKFPVLGERRDSFAHVLSGGEQRQLAIARALIAKPRLLMLDEPSIGLAPLTLQGIFDMLRRIRDEDGVDILMVEQHVVKALELSDRAYVMRVGAMDFSGPSAEVAASDRLHEAFMDS